MVQEREGFHHKGVLVMGIILLVSGVISLILGGVQITLPTYYIWLGNTAYGIWCGVFITVCGIQGILAWRFKNNCTICGLMTMCIITTLIGIILLGFSASSLSFWRLQAWNSYGYGSYTIPIGGVYVFISLLVIVTSIVCSAFTCRAMCCSGQPRQQVVVTQTTHYPAQQVNVANTTGHQIMHANTGAQLVSHSQGQPVLLSMQTTQGQINPGGHIHQHPGQQPMYAPNGPASQQYIPQVQSQPGSVPMGTPQMMSPGGFVQQPAQLHPQVQAGYLPQGVSTSQQPIALSQQQQFVNPPTSAASPHGEPVMYSGASSMPQQYVTGSQGGQPGGAVVGSLQGDTYPSAAVIPTQSAAPQIQHGVNLQMTVVDPPYNMDSTAESHNDKTKLIE